jgi:hypothetical protein
MNNNNSTKVNNLNEFLPYIYLDNPSFNELLHLAQEKNIVQKNEDKNYLFQAKIMLYTNFNKYLNLLLIDLEDEKIIEIDKKLEETKNLDEILNILENNLHKNKEDLLNKFFSYFA